MNVSSYVYIAIYVHMSPSTYEKATHMYTDVQKLIYSIVYRYTHNSCMYMLSKYSDRTR